MPVMLRPHWSSCWKGLLIAAGGRLGIAGMLGGKRMLGEVEGVCTESLLVGLGSKQGVEVGPFAGAWDGEEDHFGWRQTEQAGPGTEWEALGQRQVAAIAAVVCHGQVRSEHLG